MNDYAVYLTPEGQLFDRTTVDNLKESSDATNIKRENKAYSYKEQMEDIGKNPALKNWDQFMLNCSKNSHRVLPLSYKISRNFYYLHTK